MHELGIAKELFRIIDNKAKEHSLKKVNKIKIKIGIASGIEKDFLRHSLLDHTLPGTIASTAEIEFEDDGIKIICNDCKTEVKIDKKEEMPADIFSCSKCGNIRLEIVSGKNVYVESIEGEKV